MAEKALTLIDSLELRQPMGRCALQKVQERHDMEIIAVTDLVRYEQHAETLALPAQCVPHVKRNRYSASKLLAVIQGFI